MDGRTDRQMDGQRDRQMDGRTGRQMDGRTDRETDIPTFTLEYRHTKSKAKIPNLKK